VQIQKCFLFTVGSVCRVKRFTTETLKRRCVSGRHFYAAGFDALVKLWDKFIIVGGGYVEK
jgi:hypothetical protein